MNIDFANGDHIYILRDYEVLSAIVVSARGPKNLLVETPIMGPKGESILYRMRVARDHCVFPNHRIAIIWETWKGVNGRGGYRIERELYSEKRKPAYVWCNTPAWNFIEEDSDPREVTK